MVPHKLGSIGIALPHVEARIAAVEDAQRSMPRGEVGELMIRGPIVMQGYYGNDKATRETIEADGWLHTGDLASMDEDGAIFIVDRKKDMINTSGYKVFPAEIERVVAQHPSVAMVAVGSQPDELKGEIAKAYVVLKPGATQNAEAILALCRDQLAAYKVPRAVQFVADLPKTSTGKIMRRELKTLGRLNGAARRRRTRGLAPHFLCFPYFSPAHHFLFSRGWPTVMISPISGVASSMLLRRRERGQSVQRVVPGVEGQVEGAVVDREQHPGVQVLEGTDAFLGGHVHGGPVGVVGTVLDQAKSKPPKRSTICLKPPK